MNSKNTHQHIIEEIGVALSRDPACTKILVDQEIYEVTMPLLATIGARPVAIYAPTKQVSPDELKYRHVVLRKKRIASLYVLPMPEHIVEFEERDMSDLERHLHKIHLGRVFYHAGGATVQPTVFEYPWIDCTREEYRAMHRVARRYPVFKDAVSIGDMQAVECTSHVLRTKILLWSTEKYTRKYHVPPESKQDQELKKYMRDAYEKWLKKQQKKNGATNVQEETYRDGASYAPHAYELELALTLDDLE